MRLPTGTDLDVLGEASVRLPLWDVVWFKVTYMGKQGWISEFNTNLAPDEPRYHK